MNKTICTISVIFVSIILILSGICFAEASNTVDLKSEIKDSMDRTRESVGNVTNGIVSGSENMVNSITNGVDNIGNDMNNMIDNDMSYTRNMSNSNLNNMGNYNTTRNAVGENYNTDQMNTNTWIWIILAIAGIIIAGTVWYYSMQGDQRDNNR